MTKFKVICINDKARPDGIPTSKWIKEGETYTVIQISQLLIQVGIVGFKLAEVNIDDCFPYQFFAATRFAIPQPIKNEWAESELDRLLEEVKKESLAEVI